MIAASILKNADAVVLVKTNVGGRCWRFTNCLLVVYDSLFVCLGLIIGRKTSSRSCFIASFVSIKVKSIAVNILRVLINENYMQECVF